MNRTLGWAVGMAAAAALTAAAGAAAAAGPPAGAMISNAASFAANMIPAAPPTAAAPGSTAGAGHFSMPEVIAEAVQALPEQDRNRIADQMGARHIQLMEQQQGLESLTPQERNELASVMFKGFAPLMGGDSSRQLNTPMHPLMAKVRDNVMGKISNDIAQHNQSLCRPIIQPQVVQKIISRIQPQNIPAYVQTNTIPMFTPKIIEQVRKRFMKSGGAVSGGGR